MHINATLFFVAMPIFRTTFAANSGVFIMGNFGDVLASLSIGFEWYLTFEKS